MQSIHKSVAMILCVVTVITTFVFFAEAAFLERSQQEGYVTPDQITVTPASLVVTSDQVQEQPDSSLPNCWYGQEITTELLEQVCMTYGYRPGKYWTVDEPESGLAFGYQSGNYFGGRVNCCSVVNHTVNQDLMASTHPVLSGESYKSYNYQNQYECHGFACYVLAKAVTLLTGTPTEAVPRNGNVDGFVKLSPHEVTHLQIGDLVRVEGGGEHTALVYDITPTGQLIFLESGGGNRCRIRLGVGFNHSEKYDTLQAITQRYRLEYVYRYQGK